MAGSRFPGQEALVNIHILRGLVGLSSLSFALLTSAQDLHIPPAAGAVADIPELEEVNVSASRLEGLQGFRSPTPTTVVTSEEFQLRAAVTVSDILNTLPQVRPNFANIGTNSAGVQVLNLRGLNSNPFATRSLLLVNGHRVVGTNRGGLLDTNLVPVALVERMEVVTGGASAGWGSDAVAGVVNILFKKKLQGFQGNVQYGQSGYGDMKNVSMAGSWGTGFSDERGQFMVAAEYSDLTDPPRAGDRPWGRYQLGAVTKNVNGLLYQSVAASGLTLFNFAPGGVITGANAALVAGGNVPAVLGNANTNTATVFGAGGVPSLLVRSLDPPVFAGGVLQSGTLSGNYAVGGYGSWVADRTMLATTNRRSSFFLRSTYELTAQLDAWVEASIYNTANTSENGETLLPGGGTNLAAVTVRRSNPYLIATGLLNNPALNNVQTFTISRYSPDLGTATALRHTQVRQISLGFDGAIGKGWKWKSYLTAGRSEDDSEVANNVIQTRFHAATNVVSVNGVASCNTALTIPVGSPGAGSPSAYGLLSPAERAACVPANPFGPNSFTQAVRDYVTGTSDEFIVSGQTTAGVSVQGQPIELPAGPVAIVTGVEYRRESINDTTDPISNLQPRTVEFGVDEPGGYQWGNFKSYRGEYSVKELFVEAELPLIHDLRYLRRADLNAAARRTDYSTSGPVTSWKLGLTLEPVQGLLFRGTRSRDIRAPNLIELYGVGGIGTSSAISAVPVAQDPLQPAANYNYTVLFPGNSSLTPEVSLTNAIGVTFSPGFMEGLSTSLDYFDISIKNSIGDFGPQNIINSCGNGVVTTGDGTTVPVGQPSNPYYCSLIIRAGGQNTATNILTVNDSQVNIGLRELRGIDAEISYQFALSRIWRPLRGGMALRAIGTRINYDSTTNIAGSLVGPDVTGTFSNPRWRWTVAATYSNGPFSVNVQGLYTSATVRTLTPGVPSATVFVNNTLYGDANDIASSWYLNASARYTLPEPIAGGRLQLSFNINNVTNRDPQTFGYGSPTGVNQGIGGDLIGRSFVLGLRYTH